MGEFGKQITFKQLLDRHENVQVPMIQRDYAQGRESEKEVLNNFLDALKSALELPLDDPALPLNLDFIYGSVAGQRTTKFQPLDGQQRLTTLFLLHWYLAWQDNCFQEFGHIIKTKNGEARFSYAVRSSATEFYNELVKFEPGNTPDLSDDAVSSLIINQPWYYSYWRLDPTIQSSLHVLDAIHERFRSSRDLYARIINTQHPAITFRLLDLENFGLSDDLYIKMNARGKPLTDFETFKARYEQILNNEFNGEVTSLNGRNITLADFFSQRIDTTWADFFWKYRDTETNLFDVAVINFFRVVILLSRPPESDNYLKNISILRDGRKKSSFSLFYNHGWLDCNFYDLLVLLLEAWSSNETDFKTYLPNTRYFDEVASFKKAIKEPVSLSYAELVQFVGYVVFLREHSGSLDQNAFQQWMRVIFNLSHNNLYDHSDDMQRSISALLKMGPHSGNILQFFANTKKPTAGFNQQQVAEEKLKAELIVADPRWISLIEQAETHGYFKGQVEFLLDFCGVLSRVQDRNPDKWDQDTHRELQRKFEDYLSKAAAMFTANGLEQMTGFRWERALLSIGDYLLPSASGRNLSFLSNSATEPASWKRLLRGLGPSTNNPQFSKARNLLKQLLDRLNISEPISDQLDKIIDSASAMPEWRRAFIQKPEAIEYCEKRQIRCDHQNQIYLLKKIQLNGTHAELFTYCLYVNELGQIKETDLMPLKLEEYYSAVGIGVEPGIRLSWSKDERTMCFNLEWTGRNFIIYVRLNELSEFPELITALQSVLSTDTQEESQRLLIECDANQVHSAISNIQQVLSEASS